MSPESPSIKIETEPLCQLGTKTRTRTGDQNRIRMLEIAEQQREQEQRMPRLREAPHSTTAQHPQKDPNTRTLDLHLRRDYRTERQSMQNQEEWHQIVF